MGDYPAEGLPAETAAAELFVTVLVTAERRHAVVEVQRAEPFQPDDPVKLLKHAVQIPDNVVPCGVHMARVKAHAHLLRTADAGNDLRQLFKSAAHLTALARHGLKKHPRVPHAGQNFIERCDDQFDALFNALPHMAAGMKVVKIPRQVLVKPFQIVSHGHQGKVAGFCVRRAGIQRVGAVGHKRAETAFRKNYTKRRDVCRFSLFNRAAARIPRKILKSVGADGQRVPSHLFKAARHREMTSQKRHGNSLLRSLSLL